MSLSFDPGRGPAAFGHRFLLGLQPGPVLGDHDKRLLSLLQPAGIVLFKSNFLTDAPYEEWLASHARLLADIRAAVGRKEILVSIDHEGGGVLRPPAPVTSFAYARAWPGQAAAVGCAMGVELRSLGINVDFAPVVDVNSNPANPVIGHRAFGTTVDEVAGPAKAFLAALQAEGVMGCPKHFPGHGDAGVDSHYALPVVDIDEATFRARELEAFRRVVDADTRLVMTAHIVLPRVDPGVPATLSRRILTDILRGDLGYRGVVVSDDLGMAAVATMLDSEDGTARLVSAGCDLFCMCAYFADTSRVLRIVERIAADLAARRVAEDELQASHDRVAALLASAPQHAVTALPDATFAGHAVLAPLRDRALPRDHKGGGAVTV